MGQQNQKLQNAVEENDNYTNKVQPKHHHRGRPLPLKMNCEIFKFLKWPNQRKPKTHCRNRQRNLWNIPSATASQGFFCASSTYGKTKRLINSKGIRWNGAKSEAKISWDGLKASIKCDWFPARFYSSGWQYAFAKKGFVISEAYFRKDNFAGTIVYYFEVTLIATIASIMKQFSVGLSNGIIPAVHTWNIDSPEYYGFRTGNDYASHYDFCSVSGRDHAFEWSNGAIKPNLIWGPGVVIGCGILLNPDMKLAIFFTRDGTLMGKPIRINPLIDCLIPTACLLNCSVEANFGNNLVKKPFKFDINECPGVEDCEFEEKNT